MRLKTNFIISFLISIFLGLNPWILNAFQQSKEQVDTIKIGLLIPDNKSLAARQGAELAIRKANEKSSLNGKLFRLVVKSMEGPWGTGSKQAVSLIFDDKVCAIMGSHDGRNAHLVEQACTKARVVFLSAWSSDPTLSKAFVPWFFNCVPNDNQQADALIEEIYNKRKLTRIAVISDKSYDSGLASESLIKGSVLINKQEPLKLNCENTEDFERVAGKIKEAHIEGIILFGNPSVSAGLISYLRRMKINISAFGSLDQLDEDKGSVKDFEDVVLISPGYLKGSAAQTFRNEYLKAYGNLPGAVAAYSYDGMCLLIEAVNNGGTEREGIQTALLNIRFEGATGTIQFDEKGNRKGMPGLMKIKDGIPVSVEKY